jgi:hypothetical protein
MPRPDNIEELRNQLLDAFEWVKADPRRANQVKEMTNAAGKVLGTVKCQLEYAILRRERPSIEFLGGEGAGEQAKLLAGIHAEIDAGKGAED